MIDACTSEATWEFYPSHVKKHPTRPAHSSRGAIARSATQLVRQFYREGQDELLHNLPWNRCAPTAMAYVTPYQREDERASHHQDKTLCLGMWRNPFSRFRRGRVRLRALNAFERAGS